MRRRDLIALLGGLAAAGPFAAYAQQPSRPARVGILMGAVEDDMGRARVAAFQEAMQQAGWQAGATVLFETRWGGGTQQPLENAAAEVVRLSPDVILVNSARALAALNQSNRQSIPTVFAATADPVQQGFVSSLAKPGGHITGFSLSEFAIITKMLDLLKLMAPDLQRVFLIANRTTPSFPRWARELELAVPRLSIKPEVAGVSDSVSELRERLEALARIPNVGIIAPPDVFISTNRHMLIAAAAQHKIPAIYGYGAVAREGGLASYGADLVDVFRRAGAYVDRILKGANPGDLPIQNPTKYEMVINLKTAKALGLNIPSSVVLLADEIIE